MKNPYIALLRAVNVGGTGKLPMEDLRMLASACGLREVRTYIASGNLVFEGPSSATDAQALLERALLARMGTPVAVLVRTALEMAQVLADNPFRDHPPNRVMAWFLDQAPDPGTLGSVRGRADESLALGAREIYVLYPQGMGNSRLKIPQAAAGTARNLNTVAKLVALCA